MPNLEKVKKGDTVALLGFTGMLIGEVTVTEATKTEISVLAKNGNTLTFSRKTGIQTNAPEGKERYANKVVLPADAPEKVERKAPKKKEEEPAKPAKKQAPVEPIDDDEPDDDFQEEVDDLELMSVSELLEYAEENEIDLSYLDKKQKKTKAIVLKAIREAEDDEDWEEV